MLHGIGLGDIQKLNNDPELQEKMAKVHKSVDKLMGYIGWTWHNWLDNMDKIDEVRIGTGTILNFHPDLSSLMSIRLETFKGLLAERINNNNMDELRSCIQNELLFTKNLIRTQNKSYSAWNYRLFIYRWSYGVVEGDVPKIRKQSDADILNYAENFLAEKNFCLEVLMKDGRNFHIWNYLREMCYLQSKVVE